MFLPKARNTDIVVQQAGKELLVYDLIAHKAFNLNETSKIVYHACGEVLTFEELQRKHKFSEDLIYLTLDGLKKENLLSEDYTSPFAGLSRREIIKRVGLASMIALPVIASVVAPGAVNAASGACIAAFGRGCTFDNFKQSNCCSGLRCDNGSTPPQCFPCNGTNGSTSCTGAGCCNDPNGVGSGAAYCCNSNGFSETPYPPIANTFTCSCR